MPNSFTWRLVRKYSGNQDRKGFGLPVLASTAGRSCCKLASTRIQMETWIRPSLLWFLCLLTFSPGRKKWNCLYLLYLYFCPCHASLPSPEVQGEIQALPQPAAEWLGIQEQRCSQPCWEEVLLSLECGSAGELSSIKWPPMPVTTLKQGSAGPPLGPPVLLSLSAVTLPLLCPQMRENLGTSPCLASCLILRSTIW